ncbi:hypothetical protein HPB50_002766 [Hyalomma asiaticum]|uniref:Uncharacterized protein n=1 Tax=Hyalomma asiaticum TaxID=266040 RepID=A0ACB7S467_HYAAI|nr:hypothetical protein HPB50_002766 [Hyalomma asiaticum]
MGLSSTVFWVGHFVSAWVVSGVEAAFAIILTTMTTETYMPANDIDDVPTSDKERRQRKEIAEQYVRVYENNPEDTKYLESADGSLVLASFATFLTSYTLLALLIACMFPMGRWAMLIAFGLYFVLPMLHGEKLSFLAGQSLFGYFTQAREEKLRTGFYPNVAFSRIVKIMGIFDDFEKCATRPSSRKRPCTDNSRGRPCKFDGGGENITSEECLEFGLTTTISMRNSQSQPDTSSQASSTQRGNANSASRRSR